MIIIAHRGASGDLPEHTLAAYSRAIDLGADYIEPDLVLTKDNVFVARHDIYLSTTTDVASRPEFAHLKTTKYGRTDWFIEDFTLSEIKKLRAVQPFPGRDQSHNGLYEIPTIDEIMIRVILANKGAHKVGLYPEIKEMQKPAQTGLDVMAFLPVIKTMQAAKIPYYIQSFDPDFLRRLYEKMTNEGLKANNLIQLVEVLETGKPSVALDDIPAYIDGVGASKALLVTNEGKPSGYVQAVHEKGMKIHVWTVRDDQVPSLVSSVQQEILLLKQMGVDAIFADFPGTAIDVLRKDKGAQ